jgi:hypothetical protein
MNNDGFINDWIKKKNELAQRYLRLKSKNDLPKVK